MSLTTARLLRSKIYRHCTRNVDIRGKSARTLTCLNSNSVVGVHKFDNIQRHHGGFDKQLPFRHLSSSDVLKMMMGALTAASLVSAIVDSDKNSMSTSCEGKHPHPTIANLGQSDDGEETDVDTLPIYTSKQVSENNGKDGKPVWMSYGGMVYDVTDFISNHPGGSERILMAAGSAMEPFWNVYRQHFASDLPMRLMEKMVIGRLNEKDQEVIDAKMEAIADDDPYAYEPKRNPNLKIHSDQPMNAEVPEEILLGSYITPSELFYIRHHHPVPHTKISAYKVKIHVPRNDGSSKILELSLRDIKKLPKVEVTTTLQCSGNRRGDMNSVQRTSGTSWGQGAISTAKWGGARLCDVLKMAGLDDALEAEDKYGLEHVRFESLDGMKASIPLYKAANIYGDCILAYEMNGSPLPPDHGYPVRAIVPGYSAVRNVKWLSKIDVSKEEAEGAWQRGLNYKTLPPSVTDASTVNLQEMPSMTESSLFSGITKLEQVNPSESVKEGDIIMMKAKGWAWAGGGRNIVRVDLTGDAGKSWSTAKIIKGQNQKFGRAWAWVFWECDNVPAIVQSDGSVQLMSKSVDMAFNVQPESVAHTWNVRGLGNNSWYRKKHQIL